LGANGKTRPRRELKKGESRPREKPCRQTLNGGPKIKKKKNLCRVKGVEKPKYCKVLKNNRGGREG